MFQINVNDLLGPSIAKPKRSRCAQTQTCDVAWINVPFIVAVPPHGVLSISVSIDQHPIISGLGHTRDVTCQTCNVTVQRSSGPHNRSILIRRTPPSCETGFFVPLSKDPDVVLLPTGGSAVNPIPPCVNRHLLKGTAFDPAPHGSPVRSLFLINHSMSPLETSLFVNGGVRVRS